MKKIVETTEESGLVALLGEAVALWCECYIYAGKLVGVNDDHVVLEDAKVVYQTGPMKSGTFTDAQSLPGKQWQVRIEKIESYGVW